MKPILSMNADELRAEIERLKERIGSCNQKQLPKVMRLGYMSRLRKAQHTLSKMYNEDSGDLVSRRFDSLFA